MISVVIATRNSDKYVGETLASLSRCIKGFEDWFEIIVIDGGSTDHTLTILERSGLKINVRPQTRSGLYEALNEGIAVATGDWVMFLHSDDVWVDFSPSSIGIMPASAVVYVGDVEVFRQAGFPLFRRRLPWFPKFALKRFPFIFHPNAIYPRYLLLKYPFEPQRHGRRADMFQIARFASEVEFKRVHGYIYGFRIHAGSTTVQGVKQQPEHWTFWVWRIYVFLFAETHRWSRIAARLSGRRIWS